MLIRLLSLVLACLGWRCSAYHVCYGFLASSADLGWTYGQNLARAWADQVLGTTSFYVENVLFMSRTDQDAVMDMFIKGTAPNSRPCDLIVVGTEALEELTAEYAVAYPNNKFVCAGGWSTLPNMTGAYMRTYQGYYLAGVLAAMQPGVDVTNVGYVGSIYSPSSAVNINAFALGMRSVNSSAKVHVTHVGGWYDPRKERIAGLRFINQKVDMLLYDSDSTELVKLAKEAGIYSIAVKSDGTALHGESNLMSVIYVWNTIFVDLISVAMSNETYWAAEKDRNIFVGIEKEGISTGTYSSHVPAVSRLELKKIFDKFSRGEDEVYCAPSFESYCPTGASWEVDIWPCENVSVRTPNISANETCLSDSQLRTMAWFLQDAVVDLGFLQVPSECGPGYKMDALQEELCIPCEPGKFSSEPDQTACVACSPGYYNHDASSSACKLCLAGSYSSLPTTCLLCPAGRYSRGGVSSCTDCPVGYSLSSEGGTGLRSCELCEVGFVANVSGSPSCKQCPNGLTTKAMASSDDTACVCKEGFYQAIADTRCIPCPEGMICPVGCKESNFGSSSSSQPHPRLQKGYWSSIDNPMSVFECDLEVRCPGGEPGTCATGVSVTACDGCADGWFMNGRGECEVCDKGALDFLFVLAVLIGISILLVMHRMINTPLLVTQRTSMQAVFLVGMIITTVLTFTIYEGFNFSWKPPLSYAFEITKVFSLNLDFLAFECTLGTSKIVHKYLFQLFVVPVGFLALVAGSGLLHLIPMTRSVAHFSAADLQNTLGHLLAVFLIAMTLMSVEGFKCMTHPNGKRSLFADHTILCWEEGEHTGIVAVSIVAVLVYPVAFLSGCGILVWKYVEWSSIYGTSFVFRTRFLVNRMKPGQYGYGYAYIVRNFLLSIMPLVHQSFGVQVLLLECVFFVWLCVQVFVQPWRFQILNVFDCLNSVVQVFSLTCLGLMSGAVKAAKAGDTDELSRELGWAIIAALLGTIFSLLSVALFFAYKRISARKLYAFFLSHHKAGCALFARQVKCMLEAGCNSRVFLDVDELDNLDNLAFTVRTAVQNLLILQTQEIYSRPWCAVEIVSAWKNQVPIIVCGVDGMEKILTDEFLEDFMGRWGRSETRELSTSGVSLGDVGEAYRHVATLAVFGLSMAASSDDQMGALLLCANAGRLKLISKRNSLMVDMNSTVSKSAVFIVFDTDSQVQACVARIAAMLLEELRWCCHAVDPAVDLQVPATVAITMVLLSNGLARNATSLAFLAAFQMKSLPFVSAISQEAFTPPDPKWVFKIREGEAFTDEEEEVYQSICGSSSTSTAPDALLELYKVLAWRFNPQDTDKVMRVEFLRIADRGIQAALRGRRGQLLRSKSEERPSGANQFQKGYQKATLLRMSSAQALEGGSVDTPQDLSMRVSSSSALGSEAPASKEQDVHVVQDGQQDGNGEINFQTVQTSL